jgi:hypothetical protein
MWPALLGLRKRSEAMNRCSRLGVICAALVLSGPAFAHHSFSNFDMDKTVTLTGSVKRFEWTNPHTYLYVSVPDEHGESKEYAVEFHAIGQLIRLGFKKDSFKPGDKVTVVVHPSRDGTNLTFFSIVTMPDGSVIRFR